MKLSVKQLRKIIKETLNDISSSTYVVVVGSEDGDYTEVIETFDNLKDAIKFRNEVFLEAQGYDPKEFNDPIAIGGKFISI